MPHLKESRDQELQKRVQDQPMLLKFNVLASESAISKTGTILSLNMRECQLSINKNLIIHNLISLNSIEKDCFQTRWLWMVSIGSTKNMMKEKRFQPKELMQHFWILIQGHTLMSHHPQLAQEGSQQVQGSHQEKSRLWWVL